MVMLKFASSPHTHPNQADLQPVGNIVYADYSETDEMDSELLEALSQEAIALKNEARLLLHRRQVLLTWRKNLLRAQPSFSHE